MEKSTVLNFLIRLADGVADTFGKSCETVVHEIEEGDAKICYICNGAVSGRKIGDKKSLFGDEASIKKVYAGKDLSNYHALTRDGKLIKSTTIHFEGDNYHYAFGINFDYTWLSMTNKIIKDLIKTGPEYENILKIKSEVSIGELFAEAVEQIGLPASVMKKADRLKLVKMLSDRSAFTIQGSVPEIASKLGVSRFTIYNYLREINNNSAL